MRYFLILIGILILGTGQTMAGAGDLGTIITPGGTETGGTVLIPTCCMTGRVPVTTGCNNPTQYTCTTSSGTKSFINCDSCTAGYTMSSGSLRTSCGTANYNECVAGAIELPTCSSGQYLKLGTCTSCPDGGTTPKGGGIAITDCYLPSGTTYSDTTGKYEYTSNCYYSN